MDRRFLKNTTLFHCMTDEEMSAALTALKAKTKKYDKGEVILHAGDMTDEMGLVMKGSVRIENNGLWGNRTILSHITRGQFFAETFAMIKDEVLLVDAVANENCSVLMLNVGSIDRWKDDSPSWEKKLINNILTISMKKNLMFSKRSFHTSPKSIRGRVMAYLSSISLQEHSDEFDIPFNRQQLADYLNVERTALSKELGKMQKDGLLITSKNHFRLL